MKKISIAIFVFAVVGLAVGGYLGARYQSGKDSRQVDFCAPADLEATMRFEGAAGNVFGTFQISNSSSKTCRINGRGFIEPVYNVAGNGNLGFIQTGLPSVQYYDLAPGQSIFARYHAPNGPQCSTGIRQVAMSFNYPISTSEKVGFRDSQGSQQTTVANCDLQTEMTQVTITNMSDVQPD